MRIDSCETAAELRHTSRETVPPVKGKANDNLGCGCIKGHKSKGLELGIGIALGSV